jgi:hypothetical protein
MSSSLGTIGSFLKIFLHGVDLGGEDVLDLLNDFDFLGSGSLISLILLSPSLTLSFLGSLISESLLLGVGGFSELLFLHGEGSFSLRESLDVVVSIGGDLGSGGGDFTEEDLVLSDGLFLIDLVVGNGGFEGSSEVFHLSNDVIEGFLGESGSELDE